MTALKRNIQITRSPITQPIRQAVGAALLYSLLCASYILLSGYLARHLSETPEQLYVIETFKGVTFVVLTGVLFFVISYLRVRKIRLQEESLIEQENALLRAEKKVAAAMFAATLAHDLNNLLMSLSGLIEGVKGREGGDPFLLAMREELDVGIDKLSRLATRLASTVSCAIPEKEVDVDMKATLHELVALVRKHPDSRFCCITTSGIAPLTLGLNRTLFEQAVLNLLVNAAQATGPKGQIEVHLTIEQDAALLAIHDNGPGVQDDLATEVFEPCFTTKPDGSGIGLLAVTAFAASCGADLSVGHSTLGGALFQLRIPIDTQPSKRLEKDADNPRFQA